MSVLARRSRIELDVKHEWTFLREEDGTVLDLEDIEESDWEADVSDYPREWEPMGETVRFEQPEFNRTVVIMKHYVKLRRVR